MLYSLVFTDFENLRFRLFFQLNVPWFMVLTLIRNHMLRFHTRLAEGSGVARIKEKKILNKKLKKKEKNNFIYVILCHPQATHEC